MSWLIALVVVCCFFALAGSLLGGLTGLVPGLHPNTIAVLLGSMPQLFAAFSFGVTDDQMSVSESASIVLGCFLIGILMGHSMTEIIPTAMLGISDEGTIVAQLPSQRLYRLGRADLVIEAAAVGGLGSVALFALLFVPTRMLMGSPIGLYAAIKPLMGIFLLSVSAFVLYRTKSADRLSLSLASYILAGILGILVLTVQLPTMLSIALFGNSWSADPSSFLLPAFSGFFALPALIFSNDGWVRAYSAPIRVKRKVSAVRPLLRSLFPSMLVGWMPGLTNAYATAIVSRRSNFGRGSIESSYQYLVTYTATTIGGGLQSIVAMATIFRARNGTLETISSQLPIPVFGWFQEIQPPVAVLVFLLSASIAAVVGSWSCVFLGKRILLGNKPRSFRVLRYSITAFIIALIFWSTGPVGIFVMLSCFILGAWSIFNGASRVHLMGFLLVPVIIYFLAR
jgi:putative membrane protein